MVSPARMTRPPNEPIHRSTPQHQLPQRRRATHPDATPVVLDLEKFSAALLDGDADGGRACIERVLDELLERVCGPLNDLDRLGVSLQHL